MLLAGFFYLCGAIAIIAAAVLFATGAGNGTTGGLMAGLVLAAPAGLAGIVLLGVAQILESVTRIDKATARSADAAEKALKAMEAQAAEARRAREALEVLTGRVREAAAARQSPSSSAVDSTR